MTKKPAWVDPDDAPPLTKEFFERADVYHGDELIRRGRRPVDAAVIAALEDENRCLRQIAEQLVGELARLYAVKREA